MDPNTGLAQVPSEENERAAAAILAQIADLGATVFFEKPLTASDASGSGRVVIPKAIAEQYFPRLEQPSGLPVRAVDTRGHEYTFKFRFWINNQSRMYLLEGAGELHRQFRMAVGDVMVFAQKQDRTLVVAGRPATKNDVIRKAPVKRPAGQPGEKGKEKGKGKAKAGQMGEAARQKKRTKPGHFDHDPAVDGIFRAVPNAVGAALPVGVSPGKNMRWVVTLNLAGEPYQAYFDTQEDAQEAYNAAGGVSLDMSHLTHMGGHSLGLGMGLGLGLGLGMYQQHGFGGGMGGGTEDGHDGQEGDE